MDLAASPITVGANAFPDQCHGHGINLSTWPRLAWNQTGVGATVNGAASLTYTSTSIGAGGNTAGALTLNTAGGDSMGDVRINKDAGNSLAPNTAAGLIINGGNVIATSVNIAPTGTAARGADLNLNGGSLTIADPSQTGMFAVYLRPAVADL